MKRNKELSTDAFAAYSCIILFSSTHFIIFISPTAFILSRCICYNTRAHSSPVFDILNRRVVVVLQPLSEELDELSPVGIPFLSENYSFWIVMGNFLVVQNFSRFSSNLKLLGSNRPRMGRMGTRETVTVTGGTSSGD